MREFVSTALFVLNKGSVAWIGADQAQCVNRVCDVDGKFKVVSSTTSEFCSLPNTSRSRFKGDLVEMYCQRRSCDEVQICLVQAYLYLCIARRSV